MSVEETISVDDPAIAAWSSHDIDGYVALCGDDMAWHDVVKGDSHRFMQGWMNFQFSIRNR